MQLRFLVLLALEALQVHAVTLSRMHRRGVKAGHRHRHKRPWPQISGGFPGPLNVYVKAYFPDIWHGILPPPPIAYNTIVQTSTNVVAPGISDIATSKGAQTSVAGQAPNPEQSGVSGSSKTSGTSTTATNIGSAAGQGSSTNTQPATSSATTKANGNESTSTTAASSTTSSAPSLSGGFTKKGLALGDITAAKANAGKVGWAKNWNSGRQGLTTDIPFIPMLWNNSASRLASWNADVAANLAEPNSLKVLFTFNEPEPEMCAHQACMDVGTAVKTWGDYVEQYHGKATLVSPSVDSNEAWGKPWLDSFLSQASGKGYHIDLIGLHWYGDSTQMDMFQDYLTRMYSHFGNKKIWLTEFGVTGTQQQQHDFYKTAVGWLTGQDMIAGFSAFYFGQDAVYGLTDGNGQLTLAGQGFVLGQ